MANQNPGEIGIDLRLRTEKVAKDISDASRSINSGLASSVSGLRKAAGPTSIEAEDERESIQQRRKAIARRNRNDALDAADMEREKRRFERNNPIPKAPTAQGKLPITTMLAGLGLGIPGLASIAALAQMHPAMAAITGSMRLFQAELSTLTRIIHSANQEARQLYSKSLRSGLGTEMTARRSTLAKVIGVGEDEVYQFGAAVAFLNGRLEFATSKIAANNPTLTAAAWNVEVMKVNLEALGSTIATSAAPAVNLLAKSISLLAQVATEAAPTFVRFATQLAVRFLTQNSPALTYMRLFLEKNAGALGLKGASEEQAPQPVAFMKQMKASQWERMGLVVGSGGGTDYGRKTAENTLKTVVALQMLPANIAAAFMRQMKPAEYSLPAMP